MYYQYWGMQKAPFDNVPDPELYWSKNSSLEDAIAEVLFAIKEGNDCLAVMVGDIGSGKTLGLRVILNELEPEKYRVAFITNPDLSPGQFMREIIGQLQNKKVTTRYKDQLMEEFNAILFSCANQGQKVVIFIDEANVMSVEQLNQVRLMTNLQDDQQNMVIFVLAGQKELGRRVESNHLENLYQRIGVYCRIQGLSGPEAVQNYLSHRVQACGGLPGIFTQEAYAAIWAHSQQGVPRLINKIAKLCLKAGETNQVKRIEADLVQAVASMFERQKSCPSQTLPDKAQTQGEKSSKGSLRPNLDPELMDMIEDLPTHVRHQLRLMEDKQLNKLAGEMAIKCIQEKYPKNSSEDPVIIWDTIKGRIYSALKSLRDPRPYCSIA